MPKPRPERLTADDVREIIECYEYYKDGPCPMNFHDLAHVFDCSVQTIKRIFAAEHPVVKKHNITVEKTIRNISRAPLPGQNRGGRPKGALDKSPRKRRGKAV